jgi:hypothetical protein
VHQDSTTSSRLHALVSLFYDDVFDLGDFQPVAPSEMPEAYRRLLAHENHMTVTVEEHHGCPVDVVVLERRISGTHYARKIVLCRQSDHEVVQFGIMRVKLDQLSAATCEAIRREDAPLGRILIEHQVLRSIHLVSLFRVRPAKELRHFFGLEETASPSGGGPTNQTYGRSAIILCNEEPAVELLEIVVPEPAS